MHKRLGLEIMYCKGCLAIGCDAGQAFLHRGESNGGAPVCTINSMQEVGPATTTKVITYSIGTYVKHTGLGSKKSGAQSAEAKDSYIQASDVSSRGGDAVVISHSENVGQTGLFQRGSVASGVP